MALYPVVRAASKVAPMQLQALLMPVYALPIAAALKLLSDVRVIRTAIDNIRKLQREHIEGHKQNERIHRAKARALKTPQA